MDIDIFNGDADGIIALLQLRLHQPLKSKLVTGVKRDIQLLKQVEAGKGDQLVVLDISMAKNHQALERLLAAGASVFYVDHHQSGEIPNHPGLTAIIDTRPDVCTSLLVNDYLHGKYRAWAVAAAFGDNLNESAVKAAEPLSLDNDELEQLKQLGVCINYNGYGSTPEDLHIHPADLFKELLPFSSPFEFIHEKADIFQQLQQAYVEDMEKAQHIEPEYETDLVAVFILPNEAWARRISGVYGNYLANKYPQRAHAVLSVNADNGYLVSVRAPLNNKSGADELCSQFETGGGRKAAAGINHLPAAQLSHFIQVFEQQFSR